MALDEAEASQSGIEDGGMGGPGAPTPLSALEVICPLVAAYTPVT